MSWTDLAWVAGGYLAGTFPSTWLIARSRGAVEAERASRRDASETDAHMMLGVHLGPGWAAAAATVDVLKGFVYVLAIRRFGHVPDGVVAAAGVALVAGHAWPPFARHMAGRGLAATSGVLLALLPVPMAIAGVLILVGIAVRRSGMASTVGLAAVPVVAALQDEPGPYVAMGASILVLILLRRLEGVREVVRRGVPWPTAVWYRVVHDTSGTHGARVF